MLVRGRVSEKEEGGGKGGYGWRGEGGEVVMISSWCRRKGGGGLGAEG